MIDPVFRTVVFGVFFSLGFSVQAAPKPILLDFFPTEGRSNLAWGSTFDSRGNHFIAIHSEKGLAGGSRDGKWVIRMMPVGQKIYHTDDVFQLSANALSRSFKMTSDSLGNVYAVGGGIDAGGNGHWIIRRRDLSGRWETIDDVPSVGPTGFTAFFALGSGKEVFSIGSFSDGKHSALAIRHGTARAGTWKNLLRYSHPGATRTTGNCLLRTSRALIAIGAGVKADGTVDSFAIRSEDGKKWPMVDLFASALPQSCFRARSGSVYISGIHLDGPLAAEGSRSFHPDAEGFAFLPYRGKVLTNRTPRDRIFIRRSDDDGKTWQTVANELPPLNGDWYVGHQFTETRQGDIYVVTSFGRGSTFQRTLVRKQASNSRTFVDFDLYAGTSPRTSSAAHTIDFVGDALLVGGYELEKDEDDAGSYVRAIPLRP